MEGRARTVHHGEYIAVDATDGYDEPARFTPEEFFELVEHLHSFANSLKEQG